MTSDAPDQDDAREEVQKEGQVRNRPGRTAKAKGGSVPQSAQLDEDRSRTASDDADSQLTEIGDDGASPPMTKLDGRRERHPAARDRDSGRAIPPTGLTAHHDEVVPAEELCDSVGRPSRLSGPTALNRCPTSSPAARQSPATQADGQQKPVVERSTWKRGLLDVSRLTRVIVDPTAPLSFRKKGHRFPRHGRVLLIDNSGSMRGRPIMVAAICADILAANFRRCNVKVEVLGSPPAPGRAAGARRLGEERQARLAGPPERSAPYHHKVGRRPVAPGPQRTSG